MKTFTWVLYDHDQEIDRTEAPSGIEAAAHFLWDFLIRDPEERDHLDITKIET